MLRRPTLAQRIVIAFVLMTLLVGGSFALGTVISMNRAEKSLLSTELGRDLERLLLMDSMEEWRRQPQPDQFFYVAGGPAEFAMPADLAELPLGFSEVFRQDRPYHAMVHEVAGRRYVLLQDQSDYERRERVIFLVVAVGFVFSLLLAAVLGWLLARRVMEPVVRLARQVRHRDQLLALAPPLAPDYAPDEVGELATAFDEALDQQRQALRRERLFTSDVSHELRTPLMVLASSCELLEESSTLEARERRQVRRMARATEEMRELVQTFLQLARAQPAQAQLAPQTTVQQAADDLAALWREPIEAKGLRLEVCGAAGDPRAYNAIFLRAVMGNLLRNAWHYTASGTIRLSLDAGGFSVEDTGAGIPEAMRESVFEPFVRGEGARGEGLGLGLSLVQRICRHEGWQISLQAVEPHGCRFDVQLARP